MSIETDTLLQMVQQIRRVPSRRPRASPCHRLPLRRRRRSLRRRATPHPRNLGFRPSLLGPRVRMVQQRRALDRALLRRPHRSPLPPDRQHTSREQSPPALHLQALFLAPWPRRAEHILFSFRHPHLPFAAPSQLPRPPTASRPARQRGHVQAAQIALRRQPAGNAVGRCPSADWRDVLQHQDPEPEQSDVRHDEQHVDGRQQSFRSEEEGAEDCGQLGDASCTWVGLIGRIDERRSGCCFAF